MQRITRIITFTLLLTAVFLVACNMRQTTACITPQPAIVPTAVPTIAIPATPIATAMPPPAYPAMAYPANGLMAVNPTPTVALAYPATTFTVIIPLAPDIAAYPAPAATTTAPIYTYRIINQYPHDPAAYTQGLVWLNGEFYEGTGQNGESSLRRVNPENGEVQQMISLPEQYFGEGITIWEDQIIQLTWRENTAFVYDRETFDQLKTFSYNTEGWGITHDGRRLMMSDGTNTLYFRDPETFAEIGRVQVFDGEVPINFLNELEYIDGEVWANIWQTDRIARIDPVTGLVTAWVDLTGLLNEVECDQPADVLNGIAYDAENGRLFVTGKDWPALYEIELIPPES